MALRGGTLMATAGSVGIEATDGGGDGVLPACGASRVQVRQALVEHPVHGAAVHVLKRPEAAGGLVDDFCGHLARGQCPQHMGHVAHDPARSGQSGARGMRSEEHTSELQSRGHLVCRLLLEKKKSKTKTDEIHERERPTERRT